MSEHDKFMAIAMEEALAGVKEGEQPFGACVVRDGEVLTDVAGVELESPFSLRLNPPEDREGQPDDRWYVGINRVVANEGRTGSGVDSATLTVR